MAAPSPTSASTYTSELEYMDESDLAPSSASSANSIATPAGVPSAQALIRDMKERLRALDDTLGDLHAQTISALLKPAGEPRIAKDIESLRAQIQDQDKRQKEGIEEVMLILENVLKTDTIEMLKRHAEEEIAREIDELVKAQVALCLEEHIPQTLQDEVAEQERRLREVRWELHNSESRRANGLLRDAGDVVPLQTICKLDGMVAEGFPKTLKELFDMDAPTSKRLMEEYEIPDASDSRERNLNRLMQFLNVKYQLVREGSGTKSMGMM
ncbi:ATP-binding cassette transporter [Mycena kentingensis (nom. inval.)]|nr:ATP-binding cassette transporter [Mycena kentingensis (nom. inval.)]